MQKILFLTTSHFFDDDRILYHQAEALQEENFKTKICSLSSDYQGFIDGIEVEAYNILTTSNHNKIDVFQKIIKAFRPDLIIGSEPLAIVAARKYSREKKIKIVYDVTEWYPSQRMVQHFSFFSRVFHILKFSLINIMAGFVSTHFIFGEENKKFPLAQVFPWKKRILLPYFPAGKYVHQNINVLEKGKITLCYTGRISKEDGIGNFFQAVALLQRKREDLQINLLIIGKPKREEDHAYFQNLMEQYQFKNLELIPPVPFQDFTNSFAKADLCFDLRELNDEYSRSLPIKLFYYIGAGKPVIYSRLNAIECFMDVSEFGDLVDPENSELISNLILNYIDHPDFYMQRALNARKQFEEKYNWEIIEPSFLDFVKQILGK